MSLTKLHASLLAGLAVGLAWSCPGGACAPTATAQDSGGEAKEAAAAEVVGTEYHFGTSPARTTILFESETDLETIHGTVRAMGGSARLDWDKGVGTARLTVPVKEMKTGIDTRDEHLRSEDWLHESKFPEIVFEATSIERSEADEKTWHYKGHITIHGVKRPLAGNATVVRIPEALGKKLGRGEWVKVKTEFPITLEDFDIEIPSGPAQGKVSPTWQVKIDVFGTTEKPKQ